jgi:hypothetical protein
MLQFARLPPTFPFSTKHSHFAVDQQLTSYNLMRKCRVWACRPDSRLRYSVEIQTGCLIDNYIYNQELNVHGLEFGHESRWALSIKRLGWEPQQDSFVLPEPSRSALGSI